MINSDISSAASNLREKLNLMGPASKHILVDILESLYQAYIFYYPLGQDKIAGFAAKKKGIKFIMLNSSQALGRQNFTLAHELGHFELHQGRDSWDISEKNKAREREADHFAACFLMPEKECRDVFGDTKIFTDFDILRFSQYYRVSFEAARNRIGTLFKNRLKSDKNESVHAIVKKAHAIFPDQNFDESLYEPSGEVREPVLKFTHMMKQAYTEADISYGKLIEFCQKRKMNPLELIELWGQDH